MKRLSFFLITILGLASCEGVLFEEDLSNRNVQALAPVNNAVLTNTSVNFSWSGIEDADEYQVQIATPAFSNATQVVFDSVMTNLNATVNLDPNFYEWRVKALNNTSETSYTTSNFSLESEVFENDISGASVLLIAPSEGAVVTSNEVIFSWEDVDFAEDYIIQVATPDFENPIQLLVDEIIEESTFQANLDDNNYEWRIKARNSTSETAYTSASFEVSMEASFEDSVVLVVAPIDNFVTNESNVVLLWQAVEGATFYRIQVIDPLDDTVLVEQTTTTSNINVDFPDGNSIWQVRAENTSVNTVYTAQNITVDTMAPNTPMLQTPADLEDLPTPGVTFTWTRDPIEGTAEQDVIFVYSDVGLTNLILSEEVNDNSFSTTLTNGETYYWLMNAFDDAGNTSADSDVYSFTIQ